MKNNKKPIYHRILIKLSGDVLKGHKEFGVDINIINRISNEIKELVELGIQIGIVIGGGNLFRGKNLEKYGINRVASDHIGMLSTVINGLIFRDILHGAYINVHVMSSILINGICDNYNYIKAISLLQKNYVLIFVGGIGNPFFTTDSAACLRCIEIKAEIILKATKVNGIFSTDPLKHEDSILYDKLSYKEALKKELKIMDLSSFILARDYNLPICVFNINKPGALLRAVMGIKEGTLIIK